MSRLEETLERWREYCCQADRNGDEQCVYPVKYGEIRAVMAEISRLTAERDAALRRADAAVKCIRMMRTIAEWRGPCAENMEGGPTDEA